MPLPEYPDAIAEASWMKIAGAALEKDLGIGATLKLMKKVFEDIDAKIFIGLEQAIKEQNGKAMKANYLLLDSEFPKIEKFSRLAGEYNKICVAKGAKLIDSKATKKAGEWLVKSGKACVAYGEAMDSFGEALMEQVTSAPVEKLIPFKRDLTQWDVATLLTRTLGLKVQMINVPADIPVTITLSGEVGKEMVENVELLQEFYDAAFEEGKKLGQVLKASLEKIDKDVIAGKLQTAAAQSQVQAACTKFKTDLEKAAPVAVLAVWTVYLKEHAEYRAYQLKAAVKMGASITGVAVSVATTATTGWTGIGTIIGIIGIIKSVAAVGLQIYELWQEAAEVGKEVDEILKLLIANYKEATKNEVGVAELGAAAVKQLTGYQLDSIPKAEDKLKTYNSKLQGLHVSAVGSGADLKKALAEYDAVKKKLRKMITTLNASPRAKAAIQNLEKVILETEKTINAMVKLIAGRMETYKTGMESAKHYQEAIEVLSGQVANWSKVVQKYGVPLLGLVGATDLKEVLEKAGEAALQIGAAALEAEDALETASNAKEIVGNISEMLDMIKSK